METYTFLRELADSWVLLAMTLFFIGVVLWTFRPGARAAQRDSASIPLRNEDAPLGATETHGVAAEKTEAGK